jgi:hypothetical protein
MPDLIGIHVLREQRLAGMFILQQSGPHLAR